MERVVYGIAARLGDREESNLPAHGLKARCPTVWPRPPLAWVDPLVSPVACEVLDVLARNADVPENAIRQGVQGGPQPCTFAPRLEGASIPFAEGGDARRQPGGLYKLFCPINRGHGGTCWSVGLGRFASTRCEDAAVSRPGFLIVVMLVSCRWFAGSPARYRTAVFRLSAGRSAFELRERCWCFVADSNRGSPACRAGALLALANEAVGARSRTRTWECRCVKALQSGDCCEGAHGFLLGLEAPAIGAFHDPASPKVSR